MSEATTEQQTPPQVDKRSERRLGIDERVQATKDWLNSLQKQVDSEIITNDQRNDLIARSMIANSLLRERAGERTGNAKEEALAATEKSRKDAMTGLLNKGAYDEEISKLIQSGSTFGLLIVDIDHFKKVNDVHGHAVGDSILIQTAQNMSSNLRQIRPEGQQIDQIFRYGGEEMTILLPGMHDEEDLKKVAEKIRTAVGKSPYSVKKREETIDVPITISIGGGINREQQEAVPFFEKVDEGLYEAKKTGRNKTVVVAA